MIQFISDKMSAVFRVLNFDNKKYNTTHGNQSPIIQGNNNTLDFSNSSILHRKQLANKVIICLEKIEDNKSSEKDCEPILIELENYLRELQLNLTADEQYLFELTKKLLQAIKSSKYISLKVRAIFEIFDSNWHPLDKINFKSHFESIK